MTLDLAGGEIFLLPGGFHFGGPGTRIRTVLGSCVSITLWHPKRRIGGMCHYMLARRPAYRQGGALDGKYGEDAIRLCLQAAARHGARPEEFEYRLFGAASMFGTPSTQGSCGDKGPCTLATRNCPNVACANAQMARLLLEMHGLPAASEDLGGGEHRSLNFDVDTGRIMRRAGLGAAVPAAGSCGLRACAHGKP